MDDLVDRNDQFVVDRKQARLIGLAVLVLIVGLVLRLLNLVPR